MASNFSDDPEAVIAEPALSPAGDRDAPAPPASAAATPEEPSAAVIRFRACRWYQPPENGNQEFCTHREVKPYAGTTSFDASAWCPDCQHYKLRRSPKKRDRDDYSY